jgi:pyruvate kinase
MSFTTHIPPRAGSCDELIRELESLRESIVLEATQGHDVLERIPAERRASARNLFHYLALRSRDVRPLQDGLARLGLASLGRAEPHVLATIDTLLHNLYLISGCKPVGPGDDRVYAAYDRGEDQLEGNTRRLLGPKPEKRRVHIMVTMPSEAAEDYMLVHQLLSAGMSCMRINCAHDQPATWARMIEHLRYAERATGKTCRVLMDLSGPKLRTGAMEKQPPVLKIRPVRTRNGQILRPARIWLSTPDPGQRVSRSADATIQLDARWLKRLSIGDEVRLRDARGSRRRWRVREVTGEGCWVECSKTSYVANGTRLQLKSRSDGRNFQTLISGLPPQDTVIMVRAGDALLLSCSGEPGRPEIHDDNGDLMSPGRVSVPIPEIYRDVRPGEPVCFDDGRMAGIVEKRGDRELQIRITHTRNPVEKLRADKGVNLPDSQLALPALSAADLENLEFAARHADIVGLSFTNGPDDVQALWERLRTLGREDIGVVLKIETKRGFRNLPLILLEGLKFEALGIMIARGDLAVECGFERMAELQEEMLWVCESAHVPVIWATQVLESLTKRGYASRAEITDAAMGQTAEAVMLNKGDHIARAVTVLDDILQRMQGHRSKKKSMMRKLGLASEFCATDTWRRLLPP